MTDSDRIYMEDLFQKKMYRKLLKRWFRYQQDAQSPLRSDHSGYIGILGIIEEFLGHDLYNDHTDVESWKLLREGLNRAPLDLLKELYRRVERFKSEKLFKKPK